MLLPKELAKSINNRNFNEKDAKDTLNASKKFYLSKGKYRKLLNSYFLHLETGSKIINNPIKFDKNGQGSFWDFDNLSD